MAVEYYALPVANGIEFTDKEVLFILSSGGRLAFPLDYFPRLATATQEQRKKWRLRNGGYCVRWDEIDEDISIPLLLTGQCV
ncbi:MAG TPA: DUF2442 domain-containing protein [Spirochaetia bacterium]|nr:DUF2442 domain-containing protein [Spirochaetia bacterium]